VLPCIAEITGVYHYTEPLVKMGSLKLFARAGIKS
jgi:hypothetical protein